MSTKTTVQTDSTSTKTLSQDEIEFNRAQLDLLTKQTQILGESQDFQKGIFESVAPLIERQSQLLEAEFADFNDPISQEIRQRAKELQLSEIEFAAETQPIQKELLQLQLDEIRRGGAATPEQKALIGEITERGIEAGQTDIDRFLDETLTRIRTELAPARGLRPGDTPIADVGGRVGAEAVRQRGQLESTLRGAAASAELNFPLAASQLTSGMAGFQQQFGQSTAAFSAQLADAAAANRLRVSELLANSIGGAQRGGIGLTSVAGPSGFIESGTIRTRGTQTSRQPFGLGTILSGGGALFRGLGAVGIKF